jgi:hypothetical protein
MEYTTLDAPNDGGTLVRMNCCRQDRLVGMPAETVLYRGQPRCPRVSRRWLTFLLGLVGMTSVGCAGARDAAATAGTGTEVRGIETASGGAPGQAASGGGAATAPTGGAPSAPAAISSSPAQASSFEQRRVAAERRAIAHVEAGDVAGAEQALLPLQAEADQQYDAGSYLHSTLAWLAWAKGNSEAALEENRRAREAQDSSHLMGHSSAFYRVSLLWQRALLLIEQAAQASAGTRSGSLARARQAIDDCRDAAAPLGLGQDADLLTSLFARRLGGRAPTLPCGTDGTETDDPALLYAVVELCRGQEGNAAAQQALQALRDARDGGSSVEVSLFLQRAEQVR